FLNLIINMFLHTVTGYLLPYHHGYQRTGIHALREVSHCQKNTPERYYFAILIAPVFINKKETMK
ncbi:hypothetical protein DOR83_24245, partial [Salmonella enterica subsp. enterica serovar Virchow]|nr:hypothetical protein [Salmonella enterica subsp. enterica serovar Virchow]